MVQTKPASWKALRARRKNRPATTTSPRWTALIKREVLKLERMGETINPGLRAWARGEKTS